MQFSHNEGEEGRTMRFPAPLIAVILIAISSTAHGAQLTVMAVNTTAVPGAKVFTIGIKVTSADVTRTIGALGAPPSTGIPLLIQNIEFVGGPNGPIQALSSKGHPANQPNIQGVQTNFIDPQPVYPPTNDQLTGDGADALYRDSWWYSGNVGPGALIGYNDLAGTTIGVVTTTPDTTLGPTSNVGSTGYLWQPLATGLSGGNTNLSSMEFTGVFGPAGANLLNFAPLSGLFTPDPTTAEHLPTLTVPLAQIVATGNVSIFDQYNHGLGDFIAVGQVAYDMSGHPAGTDASIFLDYANNRISFNPEPAAGVLAALGASGLLFILCQRNGLKRLLS